MAALGDLALAVLHNSAVDTTLAGDILCRVVEELALSLVADHVLVGFYRGGESVETCAVWSHGNFRPNISYSLNETPCSRVFDHAVCYHFDDVQAQFPADATLVEMGATSYFGMPIRDHRGTAVGIVVVLHSEPILLAWDSLMKLGSTAAAALRLHSPQVLAA